MRRRDILRNGIALIGTGIVGSGLAQAALADAGSDAESVERRRQGAAHRQYQSLYDRVGDVTEAVEAYAAPLVVDLHDDGFLDAVDASELAFVTDGQAPIEGHSDVEVMSTVDHETGTPTAVLRIVEETPEATTTVFVLPQAGRSYATIEPETGSKRLRLGPGNDGYVTNDDVGTLCDWHDYHGDWEYVGQTTECTDEVCYSDWDECGDLVCTWEHHYQDEYEVYECGKVDYCDGSTIECSVTKEEFVGQSCSSDCCEELASGCCGSAGC